MPKFIEKLRKAFRRRKDVPPAYDDIYNWSIEQPFDSPEWCDDESAQLVLIFGDVLSTDVSDVNEFEWQAWMDVKVRDLPRLMREGFHWSSRNLHEHASFIDLLLESNDRYAESGWNCKRVYYLSELSDTPNWTAKVEVIASDPAAIASFNFNHLRHDLINHAYAENSNRQQVYSYYWDNDETNFNTIYQGMPLEGWWPWPKADLAEWEEAAPTTITTQTQSPTQEFVDRETLMQWRSMM